MTRPSTLVDLKTLELVARPLLARLLAPHAELLAAHSIAIDALAATAQTDRTLVRRVHAALHGATLPAPNDSLASLMLALRDLATSKGRDAILALDRPADGAAPRLPRGTLSLEDRAALTLLDFPELAAEALEECGGAHHDDGEPRGTTELEPKDARPFLCDGAFRARFTPIFGSAMHARDRTRYCDLHVRETPRAFYLDIAHGKPPQARDFVRTNDDASTAFALAQSTDVVTERARARICKETGALSLKANHVAIKEVLRRALGEAAFGDPDHWRADGAFSLDAFADFGAALSCEGVPGLASVELHSFGVLMPWDETQVYARPRKSLVGSPAKHMHAEAVKLGKVVHVKLVVRLASGAKVTVKITAKGADNRIDYARDDAEIDRVVREYLLARGIMRMKDGGEAEPFAAQDALESPAFARESGARSALAETA